MVLDTESHFLIDTEGKYVTIRKFTDGLKLCAVEVQNEENTAPALQIRTRERNQKNQVALQFRYNNADYSPKVDGSILTLEMGQISDNDSHWFEKENQGSEYWGMRTVVEPRRYLSITLVHKKQYIFILSDTPQTCVLVRAEKKD